jgi:hypothetical protein
MLLIVIKRTQLTLLICFARQKKKLHLLMIDLTPLLLGEKKKAPETIYKYYCSLLI